MVAETKETRVGRGCAEKEQPREGSSSDAFLMMTFLVFLVVRSPGYDDNVIIQSIESRLAPCPPCRADGFSSALSKLKDRCLSEFWFFKLKMVVWCARLLAKRSQNVASQNSDS